MTAHRPNKALTVVDVVVVGTCEEETQEGVEVEEGTCSKAEEEQRQ